MATESRSAWRGEVFQGRRGIVDYCLRRLLRGWTLLERYFLRTMQPKDRLIGEAGNKSNLCFEYKTNLIS